MISQIYAWLAGAHQHYGLYTAADGWARRALEFGNRHNIPFAQAIGNEFLGEDAVHAGHYEDGLKYAEREFEIAEKLRSRERRAWTHSFAAHCYLGLNRLADAEREFVEGITVSEAIGEFRALWLLKTNYGVLCAMLGRYDEALQLVQEGMEKTASVSLVYSRFEALRCLATVRLLRAESGQFGDEELDEAERACAMADELLAPTESRICGLWLGPIYCEVLLAQAEKHANNEKWEEARQRLGAYKELVAKCESPRFVAEAERLETIIEDQTD
jgi:tetratricopeptide (TPR) repeat protein